MTEAANEITPLILTWNEAPNIGRTLERLTWARRIVVVDSFSTDETEAICRRFPQVDFVQRKFDDHPAQWNFGLAQVQSEWALTLDADYVLSDELVSELKHWRPGDAVDAAFAAFRYCIFGRPLRASLYPPRAVLCRPKRCHYEADGHTQRLAIPGGTARLRGVIFHDDRKPLSRWLQMQDRYARLEAEKLLSTPRAALSWPDRLRRWMWPAPVLVFCHTLLGKGLLFEGWRGWYYVLQRTLAETLLALRLMEAKMRTPT
ncbi:MAG: glycosyltransferase family 2 protein [Verrucomicrobiae bacterium]|nr:glycosyltransferase family 2 protein [Verrucomicrobiae bacterium]